MKRLALTWRLSSGDHPTILRQTPRPEWFFIKAWATTELGDELETTIKPNKKVMFSQLTEILNDAMTEMLNDEVLADAGFDVWLLPSKK